MSENENNAGGGKETIGGVPIEKLPPKAPEKILVGNREFDAASITALQQEAESSAAIIKSLYGKNPADEATMLKHYSNALKIAGRTPEEIQAEIAELTKVETPAEKKTVDGGAPRKQEPSESDHLTASILRREIESTVSRSVSNDPTVKDLVAVVTKTQNAEVAKKLEASITAEVDAVFRSHLAQVRQQSGGIKDISIVEKEMAPILARVVERYKLMAPTIKMAGRAGPAPSDPFSSLRSTPPMEMPKISEIKDPVRRMQDIREFVSDRLHRVAMADQERRALTGA